MDFILSAFTSLYFYLGAFAAIVIRFFLISYIKGQKRNNICKTPLCEKIYNEYKVGKNINIAELAATCNIKKEVPANELWLKFAYWISNKYLSHDYYADEREIIHSMFNSIFSDSTAKKLIAFDDLLNGSPLLFLNKNGKPYQSTKASNTSTDRDKCIDQLIDIIEISYKNQKPTNYQYRKNSRVYNS